MMPFTSFRLSRYLFLISLFLVSCFFILLFIVGEPVKAAIPGLSWQIKYLQDDGSPYSVEQCLQNVTGSLVGWGFSESSIYQNSAVLTTKGDNMIINICVDRYGKAPAIVTFITGGKGTVETEALLKQVNRSVKEIYGGW